MSNTLVMGQERRFWSILSIVLFVIMLSGFARSFYLLPAFEASPYFGAVEPVFFIHGGVMSLWMVLLVIQTSLISQRNYALHRKLGLAGGGLAVLVFIFGFIALITAASRPTGFMGVPMPPEVFVIVPFSALIMFAVFISLAFLKRQKSAHHKRFIMLGTLAILDAAIARIPLTFGSFIPNFETAVFAIILAAIGWHDWRTGGKLHSVTLWGGGALLFVTLVRIPLAMTEAWQGAGRALISLGA